MTRHHFHIDHVNLCIGMVPIPTGELLEIFWSWLVGNRDIVRKRMRKGGLRRVWYHMPVLGNVAKEIISLILLW